MADVTEAIMRSPAADDDLRLGGANALAEFYLGHRVSLDLDFFALEPGRVELVSSELYERLPSTGLVSDVQVVRRGADFHRLVLKPTGGGSDLQIDLGRWMPPQIDQPVLVDGVRVEAFRELAVGKLLAVIDRGESKDVVDLWTICNDGGITLSALIDLVFVKDPGLEEAPQSIARRLSDIGRELPAGPFPELLRTVDRDEVQRWFADEALSMWRRLRPDPVERS